MRIRKYKKPRNAHRVMLVVCEGDTEEAYINLLKRHYRLPITIKTKVTGNAINSRLVSQYVKELGVDPEECEVFYIYDADVKPVLDKIMSLDGTAIISNPCIELWFVLHSIPLSRTMTTEAILRELFTSCPLWKSYAKGVFSNDQRQHLLDNMPVAASRAKKLRWPENPSSNINDFIGVLENEKKLK